MARASATAVPSPVDAGAQAAPSLWVGARRRFLRSATGMLGATLLVLFGLMAIFAGQVSPYDPIHQDFRIEREGPSASHLMGPAEFARDVFSRAAWVARASCEA